MRDDIPIPGSTRAKLIAAGIRQFSQYSYDEVDVDSVAAEAGVTTGSLYHHFQSKKAFYGVLRDDMTRRILDRMEAASESVAPEQAIKAALLAAYDGVLRIKAGKLFTEPDLRGEKDAIAHFLASQVSLNGNAPVTDTLGVLLVAALRAALTQALAGHTEAREALKALLECY